MSYTIAPVSDETLEALSVAELIDYHLERNPDQSFTVFPGEYTGEELSRISFLEFGRACHRFARAIYPNAPFKENEVVGVVVNADSLMWMTALAGIIRAGATAFPISPRNTPAAVCHLLRTVYSHRLIVTEPSLKSLVEAVKAEMASSGYTLTIQELPALPQVYPNFLREGQDDEFMPIPPSSCAASPANVVLYIHSSGSTGLPRPVPKTQEVLSTLIYTPVVAPLKGLLDPYFFATPGLPDFHTMGVWMHLMHPLYTGRPSGIFRPTYPDPPIVTSPATILAALQKLKPTSTMVIPSILEQWSHDVETIQYLKTIDDIRFGGGPLPAAVGDALVAQGCRIRTAYGCTEAGLISDHKMDHALEDWAWCAIAPNAEVRWRPAGNGMFEMEVLHTSKHVLSMENLSNPRRYATNDLWVPHPTKPGLWKIVGRADDVLILANGEKVVPGPIEGTVLAHPAVRGVVAFGRERTQIGLLVEPAEEHGVNPLDEHALAAYRNTIWGAVEAANRDSPAFGRVYKEMILVTSPSKPLPRAGKGTVQKKAALELYDEDIRALYKSVEHSGEGPSIPPPSNWVFRDVSSWLASIATSMVEKNIASDIDLFAQGFDSLSATHLRNSILGTLRRSSEPSVARAAQSIDNNFIYIHPTVSGMTSAIIAAVSAEEGATTNDPTLAIKVMISRYSTDLPEVKQSDAPKPDKHIVLLTGSTRGLGSQILAMLLTAERVERVYALNRPLPGKTSLARHAESFRDRDLDQDLLHSTKLVLLEGEVFHEQVGLSTSTYDEISKFVTTIIHNAWRLDFNLSLASFEPAVRGTRNLLELAMQSSHAGHVRFLFTSSVAVSRSWPRNAEPFPEEPQADAQWAVGNGYGEAKYVCEQLLVKAADHGLQATSLRLGQICGSHATGTWAATDWVALMLRSSVALGCLPDAAGVITWITPEAVGGAILDVALGDGSPELALNVVHPRPIAWTVMIEAAADELVRREVTRDRLPRVPMSEWYAKLADAAVGAGAEQLERIPAIKILEFFGDYARADVAARASNAASREAGGMATLSLAKMERASETMREVQPLVESDVGRWIGYWKTNGLFDDVK